MISFNTIPISLLTPGTFVEIDSRSALSGLPVIPHRMLCIAPRLNTGTIPALKSTRVRSAAEGESFFGRGSIGAAMIAAIKAANPYTDLFAIGVADAGGSVAATGTLTIAGPATASGSLRTYIAGVAIATAVQNGDNQTVIATALAASINANSALPVSANAAANVVTLTARNAGLVGNDIDIRINYNTGDATPAGLTVTIVAMSGGATNPDVQQVTAALGDTSYNTIISPFNDATSLTTIENFLTTRWGGMVMKEGQAFMGVAGSFNTVDTLAASRNNSFVTLMGTQKSPTPSYIVSAVIAALDASQCEQQPVNRPRQSMLMIGVLPPQESDRLSQVERNTHLKDGAATFVVDDGGNCRIERLVTTYKTSSGVPDTAYQDIEDMRCLAYIRYSVRVRIALKYPRFNLANDGTPIAPGAPIVTPKTVRTELIALALDWRDAGLVEDIDQFKRDLIVERNTSDQNRLDAIIPPNLINGFRVMAAQIQFRK